MNRLALAASLALSACTAVSGVSSAAGGKSLAELERMNGAFVATPIEVPIDALSAGDRKALAKLIQASRRIDDLYLQQVWSGNPALRATLEADRSPLGLSRWHLFWLYKGPWANLDENRAFLPGVPPRKLPGANFYPEGMTAKQFERWVSRLPQKQAEAAKSFYTVIRKNKGGGFRAVPYSEAYAADLAPCASLLREAALLTDNLSLKRFLTTRADALLSNDYYESEIAWMDLRAPIEVTFGPYETYNDEIFGYKASFESYVGLRDDRETEKLAYFGTQLQTLEDNLPEDPSFRSPKLGALAPIRVVNQIFASGDGAHGVMTAAYNLPNDDRVVQEKGSKRVMLKNIQEAKFERILQPIADRVLADDDRPYLSFDWFFTHILAHELMHGLGPHQIQVDGRTTNPRLELKNAYSVIEEAKADVTGLWALQYLLDHAAANKLSRVLALDADSERKLYTTYLASMFRTLRFGQGDAHGRGMALQMNFLLDHGGLIVSSDGRFEVDFARIKDAVRELDTVLLDIEGRGDLAAANRLLESATVRPEVAAALAQLADMPVDIAPSYVTADALSPP